MKGKDYLGNQTVDGSVLFQIDLKEVGWEAVD
jgi:hypothetical protein